MAMLTLRNTFYQKHKPQKGVIAMSESKVEKSRTQIKLQFGDTGSQTYNIDQLVEELGLEMEAFATSAGVLVMQCIMDGQVEQIAGRRQSHDSAVNRWGKDDGSVMLGGQKVAIRRQRLRTREGNEVTLPSYERFRDSGDRARAVYQRLISGVSCRTYEQTVEAVADGYGVSKSVVNREMVQATAQKVRALSERDLSDFDAWVLVIDGIKVGGNMVIAVLGVDSLGKKRFLGFREGSTENSRVCMDLLHDLKRRKLRMDHPFLVVIDGSPALHCAVEEVLGELAQIQRCRQHKCENVKKYLPKEYHAEYERKIKAAYAMNSYDDARSALTNVIRELGRVNTSAAASLEEGFEETLTLHRLEIPPCLRTSFATTNLIESPFSHVRTVMRNVKRWRRGTTQTQRWTATALLEAEKRFRKVRGYKSMSVLIAALEAGHRSGEKQERLAA
jgi:transposase-like protein